MPPRPPFTSSATALRWAALVLWLLFVVACASAPPPPPPCPAETTEPQAIAGGDLMGAPGAADASDAVPVGPDDPQRGRADALVTIVEFADFQCPFCARVAPTMDRVLEVYGPEQVRLVWKHRPLAFHAHARPAAEMAAAVMKLDGSDAFWRFHRKAFEGGGRLDDATLGELARSTGHDFRTLAQAIAEHGAAKVRADEEIADRLDVRGTPGFMVNGILVSGAQPFESFAQVIDAEIVAAKHALADGVPRAKLYAARVAENRAKAPREPEPREAPPEDATVWSVPVDGSPILGKADAPVTIVQFGDYECPFCARANATIAEVRRLYGDQVRVVHKHNPLPFHKQARPAARLALEILARKGNAAFWQASDALYAGQARMRPEAGQGGDDPDPGTIPVFKEVAAQFGIPQGQAVQAMKGTAHDGRIAKDAGLAEDLEATGTPSFFINGRRLTGAQAVERFKALIDEELVKAKAAIAGGPRPDRYYEGIVAAGRKPSVDLDTIAIPAPTAANPSRGPANAPIVVQVFSEFQCPFCKKLAPTLEELQKAYPTQIRVVFRHYPLPMHKDAGPAAEAAVEAFAQGGSPAFWKMHDALFARAGTADGLSRQSLEAAAREVGLDVTKLGRALDGGKHRAAVEADAKLAEVSKITGTPGVVVDRYFISGAQPLSKFRRAVDKAIADRKAAAPKR